MQVVNDAKKDFESIVAIDKEMIGTDRRKEEIKEPINQNRCLIVYQKLDIAGFLIYHTSFFECCFISLIMVKRSYQRRGLASALWLIWLGFHQQLNFFHLLINQMQRCKRSLN